VGGAYLVRSKKKPPQRKGGDRRAKKKEGGKKKKKNLEGGDKLREEQGLCGTSNEFGVDLHRGDNGEGATVPPEGFWETSDIKKC